LNSKLYINKALLKYLLEQIKCTGNIYEMKFLFVAFSFDMFTIIVNLP